jgi:hypothetical protein
MRWESGELESLFEAFLPETMSAGLVLGWTFHCVDWFQFAYRVRILLARDGVRNDLKTLFVRLLVRKFGLGLYKLVELFAVCSCLVTGSVAGGRGWPCAAKAGGFA